MTRVTVDLPRILRESAGDAARLEIEAASLSIAREEIRRRWPALATHLFAGTGELRPHVLLVQNGRLLPRGSADAAFTHGDRLEVLQAVSGG